MEKALTMLTNLPVPYDARLAWCLNSVLNVKALVGAFNHEKALVGAFSVIVKTDCETDGSFYSTSLEDHLAAAALAVPGLLGITSSTSSSLALTVLRDNGG